MTVPEFILQLPWPFLEHWGYVVVFFGALVEALPIIGNFVPGQTIVLFGGFFAQLGILKLWVVAVVAAVGAVGGDFLGYKLGARYGYRFIAGYGKYLFFKPHYLDKTKQLVHQHTGKALIIGRFNPITRAFGPFVAGVSEIPLMKFLFYNVIGGIVWAIVWVSAGYIFGTSYATVAHYIGRVVLAAILGGVAIVLGYRFVNKQKHIFERYHLYAVTLNVLSLGLFAKMVEDVVDMERITHLDIFINESIFRLWNPALNTVMLAITGIVNPFSLFMLTLALFVLFVGKKKWYHASLLALGVGGGVAVTELSKLLLHRARPVHHLITAHGYSFPSGHATMATIFFALVLYAGKDAIVHRAWRIIFVIANITAFLLIGISRIYLGVHWVSDVVAGFALGLFWLTFDILLLRTVMGLWRQRILVWRERLDRWW